MSAATVQITANSGKAATSPSMRRRPRWRRNLPVKHAKESLDRVFLSPIAGRALDLDARPSAALRSATPAPVKGEAKTKFAPCLDPIQQRLGDRVVALFARAGGRIDASRPETSA
jgi:hypothetical protein